MPITESAHSFVYINVYFSGSDCVLGARALPEIKTDRRLPSGSSQELFASIGDIGITETIPTLSPNFTGGDLEGKNFNTAGKVP